MVEGIVFEVGKNYATVFTKSGEFIKLRKSGTVSIGEIYKGKPYNRILQYCAAAAVIIFVLTSFTGYNAYAHQIVGYVDIAMGESIRLYVDRVGKVQKVSGTDEKSLKNLPIYEAIEKLENIGNKDNSNKIDVKAVKIKKSGFDSGKIETKAKQIFNKKDVQIKEKAVSPGKENKNNLKSNKKQIKDNSKNNKAFNKEQKIKDSSKKKK